MTKITHITPVVCKSVRQQMEQELQRAAAKLGLTVKFGNSKYDSTHVEFKVDFCLDRVDADSGVQVGPDVSAWKMVAERLGMRTEWLGQDVQTSRGPATIIGLRPRKRLSVVVQMRDGATRVMSPLAVIGSFAMRGTRAAPPVAPVKPTRRRRAAV